MGVNQISTSEPVEVGKNTPVVLNPAEALALIQQYKTSGTPEQVVAVCNRIAMETPRWMMKLHRDIKVQGEILEAILTAAGVKLPGAAAPADAPPEPGTPHVMPRGARGAPVATDGDVDGDVDGGDAERTSVMGDHLTAEQAALEAAFDNAIARDAGAGTQEAPPQEQVPPHVMPAPPPRQPSVKPPARPKMSSAPQGGASNGGVAASDNKA
jgi:hypothetical protein